MACGVASSAAISGWQLLLRWRKSAFRFGNSFSQRAQRCTPAEGVGPRAALRSHLRSGAICAADGQQGWYQRCLFLSSLLERAFEIADTTNANGLTIGDFIRYIGENGQLNIKPDCLAQAAGVAPPAPILGDAYAGSFFNRSSRRTQAEAMKYDAYAEMVLDELKASNVLASMPHVTPDVVTASVSFFRAFDGDGDGNLDASEFVRALKSYGHAIGAADAYKTGLIKRAFEAADVSEDQNLSLSEFVRWLGGNGGIALELPAMRRAASEQSRRDEPAASGCCAPPSSHHEASWAVARDPSAGQHASAGGRYGGALAAASCSGAGPSAGQRAPSYDAQAEAKAAKKEAKAEMKAEMKAAAKEKAKEKAASAKAALSSAMENVRGARLEGIAESAINFIWGRDQKDGVLDSARAQNAKRAPREKKRYGMHNFSRTEGVADNFKSAGVANKLLSGAKGVGLGGKRFDKAIDFMYSRT
jgi:hypothetical protein